MPIIPGVVNQSRRQIPHSDGAQTITLNTQEVRTSSSFYRWEIWSTETLHKLSKVREIVSQHGNGLETQKTFLRAPYPSPDTCMQGFGAREFQWLEQEVRSEDANWETAHQRHCPPHTLLPVTHPLYQLSVIIRRVKPGGIFMWVNNTPLLSKTVLYQHSQQVLSSLVSNLTLRGNLIYIFTNHSLTVSLKPIFKFTKPLILPLTAKNMLYAEVLLSSWPVAFMGMWTGCEF